MDEKRRDQLIAWFKKIRAGIEEGSAEGHYRYLRPDSPRDEILLRWEEYVRELREITDYYPWFCCVHSELYGREHIVRVFFDDHLAYNIHRYKGDYKKDLEAMVRYGYKGASKGGINGILLLKYDAKNNVGRKYNALVKSNFSRFDDNPIVSAWIAASDQFKACKIVSHGRHGNRIIGLINLKDYEDRTFGDALFFDVWNYR